MCNSANPYYAPTGKHVSQNGPSMRSDIEDDVSRNVTWRTDDGSDEENLDWRRGGSSSPRWEIETEIAIGPGLHLHH